MKGYVKYNITPVAKPRMTRRDKWEKRKCVVRYWDYKAQILQLNFQLDHDGWHVVFVMPMPKSWKKNKRIEYNNKPYLNTPDKDNLEKGLLDAVFGEDKIIWDGRVSKIWGYEGAIYVRNKAYNSMGFLDELTT